MFDEEPQGVIFSLARAQRWLRHAALLLGSLSTAACLHSLLMLASSPRHTGASASHTPQVFLAHLGQSRSSQCCTSAGTLGFAQERGCPRCPGSPGSVWLHLVILQSPVLWTGSFHIGNVQTGWHWNKI